MSTPAPSQTDVSVGTGRTMPAQAELLPRKKYYHNPYQPTIREILNQTDVGPGHRKVKYAYIFLAIGSCLFLAGITYTGLRIAKQFVVYRLEFLGPLLIALSFVCLGVTIKYCYDARKEGNLWRRQLRVSITENRCIPVLRNLNRYHFNYDHITLSAFSITKGHSGYLKVV